MKILVISNLYGAEAKGGAEKFAALQVAQLRTHGHEVQVMHATRGKTQQEGDEVYYHSHNIFYYADIGSQSVMRRVLFHLIDMCSIRSAWFVYRLLKKQKYSKVITHNIKGIGMLIPWGIWAAHGEHEHVVHDVQLVEGSGLIWFGHEDNINRMSATVYRAWMRVCFAGVTSVQFLSQYAASLHETYHFFKTAKKSVIVPKQNYQPRAVRYHETIHFLFVGQIETHKGVGMFVETMKQFPNHHATIVGEGSCLEQIKVMAPDNVAVLGKLSSEEVAKIMKTADVLVVPSTVYENAPRVIVEAHDAGMVVCASSIGGIPELLFPDDVMCLPTHDDLTRALQEIITRLQDVRLCLHDTRERGYN